MTLQQAHPEPKWPRTLPAPSKLQTHIHHPHRRRQTAIVAALASSIFPDQHRQAGRLADCCRSAFLMHDPDTSRVRTWLTKCGSRLCPFCGKARSARIAEQIHDLLKSMSTSRHLTLTYRSRDTDLGRQLNELRAAFAKLRRHPEWISRVKGGVYTIEITRNAETGQWHPHLHVITHGSYFPQPLLAKLWSEHMDGGLHVWITIVKQTQSAAWELAKYVGKPPAAEGWPAESIRSYATAVNGARLLQTFGDLHGRPAPEPDEPPTPEPNARSVSIPRIAYLASTHVPVAEDLVALVWTRYPFLRGYLEEVAPHATTAEDLQTNDGLHCPRPPMLPDGRYGPIINRDVLAQLDNALDLTLLLFYTYDDAGELELMPVDVEEKVEV